MKKLFNVFVLAGLFLALLTPLAAVNALGQAPLHPPHDTFSNVDDVFSFMLTVANWIFSVLLVFGVIWLLVGAFKYLTASGDAEARTEARDHIIHALIAIAIGVLSLTAVNIVSDYFGGPTIAL
ncbi:MAG: hypothetical protein Q8R13_00935 [bacterium]|nr:hypothetical protein [bacterium]MDZ4295778.1 hypothetical protein [Patescibacteria group bacterium]